MVFINGVKYACSTCIKGHRSTTCQHSDRLLYEIKKKGRPVTQCTHCRELRKTKKVHAKCNCLEKEAGGQAIDTTDKTSVAALLNPCMCVKGAECICCRPTEIFETRNHFEDNCNISHSHRISSDNNDNIGSNISPYSPSTQPFNEQNQPQGRNINSNEHSTVLPSWKGFLGKDASLMPSPIPLDLNSDSFNSPVRDEGMILEHRPNDLDGRLDQSKVLGEQLCNASSDDLIKVIYHPFRSCSSAMADGSCCGTSVSLCRCGIECSCDGCNSQTHFKTLVETASSLPPMNNCCSPSPILHVVSQPEHTTIVDEDGVTLCGCGCDKTENECSDCLANICEEYLLNNPS